MMTRGGEAKVTDQENSDASHLVALGSLLPGDGLLLTHGGDDGDEEILAFFKGACDFLANVGLGYLDIVLGNAVVVHQVEETIIDVDLHEVNIEPAMRRERSAYELIFVTRDVGDIHVVGGGTDILLFGAFISILAIAWTAIRTNFLPVKICTNIST